MSKIEKQYPIIVRIYWDGLKLFSKLGVSCPNERYSKIAYRIAEAVQDIDLDVPIEIALLTQSASIPNCVEVLRVDGVDITSMEKPANFLFSDLDSIVDMNKEEIQHAFLKGFPEFCKGLRNSFCDERSIIRQTDRELTEKIDVLEAFKI